MRKGRKSRSRMGLRQHVLEHIRVNKPGRSCIATCRDGDCLVFVDTKYGIKAYPNRWECFVWCRKWKTKILLPSLPAHPDSFLKCIVNCGQHCWLREVVFYHKDPCSYIYAGPLSQGWKMLCFERYGTSPYGKYDAALYTLRGKSKKDYKNTNYCVMTQGGGFYAAHGPTMPFHNASSMYERNLVQLNDAIEECFPEAECLLVERKLQCGWEVWEVDTSHGEMRRVNDLRGLTMVLTTNNCFVYKPKSELERNCIYFTEEKDGDPGNSYVFRIDDQSLSIVRNLPLRFAWTLDTVMPYLRFIEDEVQKILITDDKSFSSYESCDLVMEDNICCDLSDDLKRLIANRIPCMMDYANLRLVNRNWRRVVPPMYWKPQLISNSISVNLPWLMLAGDQDSQASVIDPTTNMRGYISNHEILGCKIRYSNDGWLLVTKGQHEIFFFEPISKNKIALIDIPHDFCIDGIAFSSSPTSPTDWVIIAVLGMPVDGEALYAAHLKPGYEKWRISSVYTRNPFIPCGCNPVFHDDEFYTISQDGELAVLSPERSQLRILTAAKYQCVKLFSNYRRGVLVACGGNLHLVIMKLLGKSINVYKLQGRSGWIEVKHIDNFAFFISQTSSFAVQVTETALQNSIKFPLFEQNCNLFYKVDEGKFKLHRGGQSTGDIYDRKELFNGTWLQPKAVRAYR